MDPKLEEMIDVLRSQPAMSDMPIDKLLKYAIGLRDPHYSPQLVEQLFRLDWKVVERARRKGKL